MSAIDPMRPTHSAHTGMCMYLAGRSVRNGRPGWWLCELTCKQVLPHNHCTRSGCRDYREAGDAMMPGDKKKRFNWDEPANMTVKLASDVLTLREWARDEIAHGVALNHLAGRIGCTWSTLQNAVKQPVKQGAPEPKQVMDNCWNCDKQCPEDDMHLVDGDTPYCPDCYRALCEAEATGAVEVDGACDAETEPERAPDPPAPSPPAARCQRCECEVDGRLIMSGVGTVCEPCAEAIRQEWEAEQYPKTEPEPQPRYYDPTETRKAAQAYLRHIGLGDQEVFALGIWLDAWAARGEPA